MKAHLSAKYSRHFSLIPKVYGRRGGHEYFKPCGWTRIARAAGINKTGFRELSLAYYGTSLEKAMLLLAEHFFLPRSREYVIHGQRYSSKGTFSGYVSPSIEYASHPVYASCAPVGDSTWIQAVVEVRVKPGSSTCHPGSLRGPKHWDADLCFDENFPTRTFRRELWLGMGHFK